MTLPVGISFHGLHVSFELEQDSQLPEPARHVPPPCLKSGPSRRLECPTLSLLKEILLFSLEMRERCHDLPASAAAKHPFPPRVSRVQAGPSLSHPYPMVSNIIVPCTLASLSLLDRRFLGTATVTAPVIVSGAAQAPPTFISATPRTEPPSSDGD